MGTFGERFLLAWDKWKREHPRHDASETAFAAVLGIPQGTLNPLKKRIDAPRHEHVIAIARATGTDPGWLAYGPLCQAPMPKEWPAAPRRDASTLPDLKVRLTPVEEQPAKQRRRRQ